MVDKIFRTEEFAIAGVRGAFMQGLFEAQEKKRDDGSVTFSHDFTLLIPKTDTVTVNILNKKIEEAAVGQHGREKAASLIKNGALKSPLLDGDGPQGLNRQTGERRDGFAGHWFLRCTATAKYPPQAVIARGGKWVPATSAEIYSGCYVNAVLSFFNWYNAKNGWGISPGCSIVYFAKDGDRLGGGGPADPNRFFEAVKDEGLGGADTGRDGASSLFS